jgi:hypothetical protein
MGKKYACFFRVRELAPFPEVITVHALMAMHAKEKLKRTPLWGRSDLHAAPVFLAEPPSICRVAAFNASMIALHAQLVLPLS